MNRQLTAIVEREGDGYVALCPEVDVASQGDIVTEARDNLTEALSLFFETASAEEMDRRLRSEVYVTASRLRLARAAKSLHGPGRTSAGAFEGKRYCPGAKPGPSGARPTRRRWVACESGRSPGSC